MINLLVYRTHQQQLCTDTGYSLEDKTEGMDDIDGCHSQGLFQ